MASGGSPNPIVFRASPTTIAEAELGVTASALLPDDNAIYFGRMAGRWDPVPNQRKHWALKYLDVCPRSPTSYPMQGYSAALFGTKTEIPVHTGLETFLIQEQIWPSTIPLRNLTQFPATMSVADDL
jgi:hypothetical protein